MPPARSHATRLLATTAFRVAAANVAAFALVTILGFAGLYWLSYSDLSLSGDPARLEELQEIFFNGLIWTLCGALLAGLVTGTLASRQVLRGVASIAEGLERIGAGELAHRIPPMRGSGELARIAGALNAMAGRVEALTESLREVTDDIAHDLRTPLSRLRQRLERDGNEAALAEADAIIATFNALLRIAQIEAQGRRAGFATVDLSALMQHLAEAYGPAIEDGGRSLKVTVPPGLKVRGDGDLLGQMTANLIENAMRHTPAGSRITLAALPGQIVVGDDGPGIAPDQHERVLRRFVRLDSSRATPGTGLGLALVRAVADLHGATLQLEDARPGLRVVVELPHAR